MNTPSFARRWILALTLVLPCLGVWTNPSRAQTPAATPASGASRSGTTVNFWGTGFVVAEGYVITALHVVSGKTGLLVGPDGANRWSGAELVQSDTALDLALLKSRINAPVLSLASSANLPTGLEISVIGYPLPRFQGFGKKITNGIINGYRVENQNAQDIGLFQFSAEVARGNSGGPVFAPDGSVIGMVQRKIDAKKVAERAEDLLVNVNYALRSSQIIKFLQAGPAAPRVQSLALSTLLRPYQLFEQSQASVMAILGHGRVEGAGTPEGEAALPLQLR